MNRLDVSRLVCVCGFAVWEHFSPRSKRRLSCVEVAEAHQALEAAASCTTAEQARAQVIAQRGDRGLVEIGR